MRLDVRSLLLSAALASTCLGGEARATVASGTIIGVFSDVVTTGYLLNTPSLGAVTYSDNTATAVYSIANSTDGATLAGLPPDQFQANGSALSWGTNTPSGPGSFSTIAFFGAPIPDNLSQPVSQPFRVGRITYQNGTSATGTSIFGASISFYAGSVTPANFLGTDTIVINTTTNLSQSTAQDSDYINICGNQSNICDRSVNAVESFEGGTGVTVDLFGVIVGDPQLFLTDLQLAPGQSSTTNGFVGSDPALAAVPEPASLALLGGGLLGLGYIRRRRG